MSESSKKEELLRALAEAKQTTADIETDARRMAQGARQSVDMARSLADFVQEIPNDDALPSDFWRDQTTLWCRYNDQARVLHRSIIEPINVYDRSVLATTSGTSVVSADVTYMPIVDPILVRARQRLVEGTNTLLNRPQMLDRVRRAMTRLGLHNAHPEMKSPLVLLGEAEAAIQMPPGSEDASIAAFLALREAIHGAVAELLRRRPRQEETGSGKLISIGRQCRRQYLGDDYFKNLETAYRRVNDQLSAKGKHYTREQVSFQFNSSLSFLESLLEGVDETRLR